MICVKLEVDLGPELQLAHVRLAAPGDRTVDAGDKTGIACAAIDATRVRCIWNTQRHMVEDVESLELELPPDSFCHGEVLEESNIREIV